VAEPEATRPSGRPPQKERPKSPYYKASLVLAIVFLALAVSLPFWLDRVRQPMDRGVLDRDLQSVAGSPAPSLTTVPPPALPVPGDRPATGAPSTGMNGDCRAYVYARCNTLRIPPAACLPIALDAVKVPLETGLVACREAVDDRLSDAAREAGTNVENEPAGGAAVAQPGQDAAASKSAQGGNDGGKAASGRPPATSSVEAAMSTRNPSPEVQAEKLAKVLKVLDELQRGANGLGTLPATQDARLSEIRGLVEEVGTEDAKKAYNQLRERYVAPPPAKPGATVGESPRVETGVAAGNAPPPSPESERVRALMNDARKQAGMAPVQAPDPNEALRAHSPDEAAAPSSIEQRP